ncbi:unnamed protein product [Tuber aestivum]|uniref:C2H2-type domain-containing protein n=1 Tax=Tuber aestivum TaxID=59557 RepID=A0A292Q0P3_9PEZI|nr:unnamed protein product [Tuber aestivum]
MSQYNHNQHNFPEGSANLDPSHQTNVDPRTHNHGHRAPEPIPVIFPNAGDLPSTLELSSRSASPDSDGGIETNHSSAIHWGNIDAFTQDGSPLSPLYPTPFATTDCDLGPDPLSCRPCGIRCSRPADLKRHLDTSRVHSRPKGPICQEPGCKSASRFTRVDNFKTHYVNIHGKSRDEADEVIREWKAQNKP